MPLLPDNYPGYKDLRRRSDVLDELAVYAGNVHLQDSLLKLASMSPEQQRAACQKIVDDLIKREKEEAEKALKEEYLAKQEGQVKPMDKTAPAAPALGMNTDKSWYFYNTMTKNAGKTEFQRRWGARKLEDDWRRRNKSTFSLEEPEDDDLSRKMAILKTKGRKPTKGIKRTKTRETPMPMILTTWNIISSRYPLRPKRSRPPTT